MAKLVVLSEGLTGTSYELKVDKTTIGRLDDNTFQISEPSVSSHHCEVVMKGEEILIKDLGSTNGTFISGEKIAEQILKPGQILRLGSVEMRLETEATAAAAAAATKKKPDQNTRVIPRGVKLNEVESSNQPVKFDKDSPFAKKNNKMNVIFISIGVVLALVIVTFVVLAFMKMGSPGQ